MRKSMHEVLAGSPPGFSVSLWSGYYSYSNFRHFLHIDDREPYQVAPRITYKKALG